MNKMNKMLYVIPSAGAVLGAYVSYENEYTRYIQRLEKSRLNLQAARSDYDNRDMSGSKSDYAQRKSSLNLSIRDAEDELRFATRSIPNKKTQYLCGGIKGALFPMTVPYYLYKRSYNSEYYW